MAVVSTGDELCTSPGLREGCIPGPRSALHLAAAAQSVGADVVATLLAPGYRDALEDVLDRAAAEADLVVSSGGLGVLTQPAAQAMLHAIGLSKQDLKKPQIGIASTGWDGNPCNMHLNGMAVQLKGLINKQDLIAFNF